LAWLNLSCDGWRDGGAFPARYKAESPPCRWNDPPPRTKSFALLLEEVDVQDPRVLWLVYDLGEEAREIVAGLAATADPPSGGRQGRNDLGSVGYAGVERNGWIALRLFALDRKLGLPRGAFPIDFRRAAIGHIVETSELLGAAHAGGEAHVGAA
jgi:phosphatidylethanolamine-binding protein (PEBP) family uncharacterized protein